MFEINPAVAPIAAKFFDLDTNKITLTIDDGRHYLNKCRKKYDAVILDAFLGDSSPSHLFDQGGICFHQPRPEAGRRFGD